MSAFLPDLWIIISLTAAVFQTVRFMLQKHLATATLTAAGATFSRFFYALPFVTLLLLVYLVGRDVALPAVGTSFWGFGLLGACAQITATVCTVLLFKQRNFAVGMTFTKTEVIQTVLVGWLLLGEGVSPLGFMAISIGIVGLLLLSAAPAGTGFRLRDLGNKASALGIASGILFAFSGVSYRGATLAVAAEDPFLRAGLTLTVVVAMQTVIMLVWLRWREPGQIAAVWKARRVAVWIGLTSMAGSLGWFTAFALQNAAYVKAVGQVEIIFSIVATVLFFRERITAREALGMAILSVSILLLILVI
ncbi:DMT family transporter [Sulfitobacter sp. M57]|uniref:DMT family transporter n=1 Tax=unclassified Sulfitobacter TaxID=196795 RepID=UPI0023E0CC7C|nr:MULTISPECIES: DMT family transporter [unclassified Sulfitobacter]MDF3413129.1 DMT family transporter [Sulfitobacter sp. KE5]MDF3421588.1 DMT family transporter [Sulfitobacter sp. KE43]MDF3431678.1 DMT family transporter [Sulfitobacter sp. KE42]MDF3457319.1 DMT family transporter [Sulfitobacter sp. S74]MDF3461221.1 DMT family transporter [Sulfitobacter sp. Ks18]